MSHDLLLVGATAILVVVAVIAALPSLWTGQRTPEWLARCGDPLAAGVFLGAGLVHLLPDAVQAFAPLDLTYPWPFALCGAVVVALAIVEQGGRRSRDAVDTALFAAVALAIHSLLAGAALGATRHSSAMLLLFLALVAHKGAASFSLSRLLADSGLARRTAIAVQGGFVLALPVGILLGAAVTHERQAWPLALPTALAVGAGTFLYFGTLHRAGHGERRRSPGLVGVGFALMAIIAWLA